MRTARLMILDWFTIRDIPASCWDKGYVDIPVTTIPFVAPSMERIVMNVEVLQLRLRYIGNDIFKYE